MPDPITAIAVSGGIGAAGSLFGANAQSKAAGKAADASVESTKLQIEATEKATEKAIAASKEGNRLATASLTGAANRSKGEKLRGQRQSKNALIAANDQQSKYLVGAEKGSRDAKLKGISEGLSAFTAANLKNNAFYKTVLDDTIADQKPWQTAGAGAIKTVSDGLASGRFSMDSFKFEADPGYEFRKQQGEDALARGAAAGGGLLGGNQIAAAQQFSQGLASQEYQAAWERGLVSRQNDYEQIMGVADRGQRAAETVSAARGVYGDRVGKGNLLIGEAGRDAALARGDVQSDFAKGYGVIRGSQAAARGNILSTTALANGTIRAEAADKIGQARAQGSINVANAAMQGATNSGNVIANAYAQQGQTQAAAYTAQGQAQAAGWQGVAGAANTGIQNWLTYDLIKNMPAYGSAG